MNTLLDEFEVKARHRWREIIAYTVIVFAVAVLAFGAGRWWLEALQWDPLGDYPVQVVSMKQGDVASGMSSTAMPAFYLDEVIHTEGVKCVKSGEGVVTVRGVLSWVSDEPPGRIIDVSTGGGQRGPSCVNYLFENTVPPQVREEVEEMSASGRDRSVWHLSGTETPVRSDGTRGVERTWITTSFVLIHREAP